MECNYNYKTPTQHCIIVLQLWKLSGVTHKQVIQPSTTRQCCNWKLYQECNFLANKLTLIMSHLHLFISLYHPRLHLYLFLPNCYILSFNFNPFSLIYIHLILIPDTIFHNNIEKSGDNRSPGLKASYIWNVSHVLILLPKFYLFF